MIVIATDKMYVVANKIHSIYLDEDLETRYLSGKKHDVLGFLIKVTFEPDNSSINLSQSSRSYDLMTVEFKVFGHKRAIQVYRDIVSQIREQCPDQVYLDRVAELFLARSIGDDPSTEEICLPREKERRSKEVLRRAVKRSGRRSKRSRY